MLGGAGAGGRSSDGGGVPVGAAEVNWGAVGSTLLATVLGAFAALWAQGAPVNRGMRAALYVTIGFVGSLLFLVGLMALLVPFINPWGPIVAGLAISLPLWRPFREAAARLLPIDPASATHAVALIAVLLTLLVALATLLRALAGQPPAPQPTSAVEIIAQHLGALALAFFGVGLGLRRTLPMALDRLGLGPLGALVALGSGLAGLAAAAAWLGLARLNPTMITQPDRITALLASQAGAPVAALLVAVAVAAGMEVLFRGALQPRLGLPLTALTFVAVNVISAAPLPLLWLLAVGVALGLLRRRLNTSASLIAHAAYNGGRVLLALLGLAA